MEYATNSALLGIGATLMTDFWALLRRLLLGIALPDYGLVGRWIAHMPQGRFRHERIAATAPVAGERVAGWLAHYLIGIGFAGVLLALYGTGWVRHPTLASALAFGIATTAAPFFLMQPGMGHGIAASRTPRPHAARAQSFLTHAFFGAGLYAAARLITLASGE
jgi:hypothetical protein